MVRRAYEIAPGPAAASVARAAADASCEGVPPHLLDNVRLLVSELVTNSVRHGGVGSIDPIVVRFAVGARFVRVAVTDHGSGFEPRVVRPEHGSESGYGLYLVERLADRWGARDDGAMTVWFELARNSALPLTSARATAAEAFRAGRWVTHFWWRSVVRSARLRTAQHDRTGRPGPSGSPRDALRRNAGPTSTRPRSRTAPR